METRWPAMLGGTLLAIGGVAFLLRRPGQPGALGTALVFSAASAWVAISFLRGRWLFRVAVASLVGAAGATLGLMAWYTDRYPTPVALDSAIAAVAPKGFREHVDARNSCSIGCETSANRSYTGSGTVAGVAEEMAARLRRACYADAAVRADAAGSVQVGGTCPSKNITMGVQLSQAGSEVEVFMSAYQR